MIRWLSNAKIAKHCYAKHSTEDLRRRIHVHHIEDVLRWNRMRLSGHLYRQEGKKLGWKDVVNADLRKKHLNISLASDRSKWRNAIRQVTQQIALQPTMSGTGR